MQAVSWFKLLSALGLLLLTCVGALLPLRLTQVSESTRVRQTERHTA